MAPTKTNPRSTPYRQRPHDVRTWLPAAVAVVVLSALLYGLAVGADYAVDVITGAAAYW
ncbi:hypothetical protein [Krasilnikoviella flava]|nr:hypothetical protein [Krasilnikoviella flava]